MEKFQDKRTMIIFLLVVLGIVIFLWLVLPSHITVSMPKIPVVSEQEHVAVEHHEGFDGEQVQAEQEAGKEAQVSKQIVSTNAPFIDPKTGTLIDGPGFEKGEMEGAGHSAMASIPSNFYMLDDGAMGEQSIQHNLCSKSCCSEQWPTPFKQRYDPYVCANKANGKNEVDIDGTKFTTSSYFCNNSFEDAGLTK